VDLPLPVWIAIGVVLGMLILFGLRRGGPRDLVQPPQGLGQGAPRRASPPPPADGGGEWSGALPADVEAEVRLLLGQGNKIEAIKIVRAATRMGLGEAKELVERM
jgi:hypothetical protein